MSDDGRNLEALRASYRVECADLLVELEAGLLELEQRSDDAELVARVFRALHTIKGSGAMFGFGEIVRVTHGLETCFEDVRSGKRACTPPLVALALTTKDLVQSLLDAPPEGDPALADSVRRVLDATQALVGAPSASERHAVVENPPESTQADAKECAAPTALYRIRFRPTPELLLDGTNPAGLWAELRELGRCEIVAHTEDIPGLTELDPEHLYVHWEALLETSRGEDAIRDVFIFVEDRGHLQIERLEAGPAATAGTEGPTPEAVREPAANTAAESTATVTEAPASKAAEAPRTSRAGEHVAEAQSVRVAAAKLDSLVDLVGELVIAKARLLAIAAERDDLDLHAVAENIDRLSADLRDTALNLRMVPIGTTFARFRRLVRDLAGELGKEIELRTEGAETELDKTVIERLGDPLVHLIRNCCDHGIESPAARVASAKPAQGTVSLYAFQSGPNVVIEIRDDGKGLDTAAIRQKAIERGLLAPDAEPSESAIQQLVFHPGLSTAERVSNLSGRGVGMDVVKQAVEALRGTIELESRRGQGTTIRIRLPLTLAIIEGLLVAVGDGRYVLPMSMVQECVEITRADVERAHGSHLAPVRGELVPYIRLREWFGVGGDLPAIEQIAIANAEGVRFGFVVDDVVGQHQTVVKSLGHMYRDVGGLAGATILGDGTVALIVDVARVMRTAMPPERAAN